MAVTVEQIAEWVPKIIESAARVLAEKGMFAVSEELLTAVSGQPGVTVAGQRVCFEESVTVGFLERYHAARPFTPPARLTVSSGAHANHIVDLGGALRPITQADLEWAARLGGALGDCGLTAYAPGIHQNVPAPLQGLGQLLAGAKNKPGAAIHAVHYPAAQPFIRECQTILGQGHGAGIHVVSPLRFEGQEVDEALALRRENPAASIGVGSMPIVGVSTPATALAGAVTALAEVVGGALLMVKSGTPPERLGMSVNLYPFDMRHGCFVYGTPSNLLLTRIERELNRYLGTEISAKTFSVMAQRPGAKSCALKGLATGLMAAEGRMIFSAAGSLSLDEVYSPVQLLYDREILAYVQRSREMMTDSLDEALLLVDEIIADTTGSFLGADSTLDHFRTLQWDSGIFPTRMLQQWCEAGEPDEHDLAVEEIGRLLAGYEFELEADKTRALDEVYARARAALL